MVLFCTHLGLFLVFLGLYVHVGILLACRGVLLGESWGVLVLSWVLFRFLFVLASPHRHLGPKGFNVEVITPQCLKVGPTGARPILPLSRLSLASLTHIVVFMNHYIAPLSCASIDFSLEVQ